MSIQNKKRVVLKKVEDNLYPVCFHLGIYDPKNPEAPGLLVGVHALDGKQFNNHLVLMMRTPFNVRWRTYTRDTPFGIAHTIQEAERKLYEKLRTEAPSITRRANHEYGEDFHAFYDETGRSPRYNYVRPKTSSLVNSIN